MSRATRHTHDVARRSRPARSDARFSLSSAGSMSSRRSTRYTVVPSRAPRGPTRCPRGRNSTRPRCARQSPIRRRRATPRRTRRRPRPRTRADRWTSFASRACLAARRLLGGDGPPIALGGRSANASGVNGASGISKRANSAAVSASASPAGPNARSTRASGCRLVARHPSTRTRRRWPSNSRRGACADEFRRAAIRRNRQDAPEGRASRRVGRKVASVRLGDDGDVVRATSAKDADHLARGHERSESSSFFGRRDERSVRRSDGARRRSDGARHLCGRITVLVLVLVVGLVFVRFVLDDGSTLRLDPSRRG